MGREFIRACHARLVEVLQQYIVPVMYQCDGAIYPLLYDLIQKRAMQGGLDLIKPLLAQNNVEPVARAVIGAVKSDIHDIGKNMVAKVWEGAGFEVVDLGVNVPP